jgi:D-apionolactonase
MARMRPAHLRVELTMDASDWRDELNEASDMATACGAGLELAVFFSDEPQRELEDLAKALSAPSPSRCHLLLFHREHVCTQPRLATTARDIFGRTATLIGGTDAFFAEFNRARMPFESLDGGVFSINPQLHTFDERSIMQTVEALPHVLASATAITGGKAVHVSPVTLTMRWNPAAGFRCAQIGGLNDDPRHRGRLGADWTRAVLSALHAGGAASATCHQSVGPLGIMDEHAEPYPVYDVLVAANDRA